MFENIQKKTIKNSFYRTVLYTDANLQLVLMSINKNEDIPLEIHDDTTQFIKIEDGRGVAMVEISRTETEIYPLLKETILIIPKGKKHYISNMDNKPLKLYSIYSPPEHKKNLVQKRQPT